MTPKPTKAQGFSLPTHVGKTQERLDARGRLESHAMAAGYRINGLR